MPIKIYCNDTFVIGKGTQKANSYSNVFRYTFNYYNVLNEHLAAFIDMKTFVEHELSMARANGDKVRQ